MRVNSVESTQRIAKILVVDDHPILRLGVRQMITADPGLSICAQVRFCRPRASARGSPIFHA